VALTAHIIIEAEPGEIGHELSARMDLEQHGAFFSHQKIVQDQFPLFWRLQDHSVDAHFVHRELESLIGELERVSVLFALEHPVKKFLGPFHTLCCVAFCRDRDVHLHAT